MDARLRLVLEQRLSGRVTSVRQVQGGDIHRAFAVTFDDQRKVFVKANPRGLPKMFQREAEGLRWLSEPGALRVPGVLAWHDAEEGDSAGWEEPSFLALELIDRGAANVDHERRFGRGLATLHRCASARFGLDRDNYIATLHQDNRPMLDWPQFYAQRRLQPQLTLASSGSHLSASLRRGFERIMRDIKLLCGPDEPPARLHGDLWRGNVLYDEHGTPTLVDPAAYAGHREVDLAMMQLFGGFGAECFAAYDEVYPRADGHERRLPLYQLYPLLVHLNLFGGAYVAPIERALRQLD